ncbi:MAG TPA: hypothetical protein VJ549_00015 [Geothrix sp.]|nr:hypothetical protein [Geothrix sp.]
MCLVLSRSAKQNGPETSLIQVAYHIDHPVIAQALAPAHGAKGNGGVRSPLQSGSQEILGRLH